MLSTDEDRVEESEYAGEVDRDGEMRDDSRETSSSVMSRESARESGIVSLLQLRRRSMEGERTVLGGIASNDDCAWTTLAVGVGGSLMIVSCIGPRS